MACPQCGAKSAIIDSRQQANGDVARRYKCLGTCQSRWSTVEMIAHMGKKKQSGLTLRDEIATGLRNDSQDGNKTAAREAHGGSR